MFDFGDVMGALDPSTLIFATAVILLVTSTAVLLGGYVNRRSRGVRRLVAGYLLMSFGVGLGATQDFWAPLLSKYTANIMILTGLYLAWMGVRQMQQLPVLGVRVGLPGFIIVAGLFAFIGVDDSHLVLRVQVFGVIAGTLSLLMARELLVTQHRNISDIYTGSLFVLLGIVLFARTVAVTFVPDSGNIHVSNTTTVATYLSVIVLNLLLAFGYIMMMTERLEQRLRNLADTDYLTGMNCRRAFVEQVERVLARAQIDRTSVSMVLLDIDDFKKINDTYGHVAGDDVLRHFAANMSEFFRIGDVLGRIGGEEFGVVLSGVDASQAAEVAERLRKVFEASLIDIGKHSVQARVSIGVASTRRGESSFESLYRRADDALYRAKEAGKNQVCVAEE